MHTFKKNDIVTIFKMSPSKGLLIEGMARVVARMHDVDEWYEVAFLNDGPDETYQRFVDTWGQKSPQKYVSDFNKKIASR